MFLGLMEHLHGGVLQAARHLGLEPSKWTWAKYKYSVIITMVEDAKKCTNFPSESMCSEKRKGLEVYYLVNGLNLFKLIAALKF